MYRVSFPVAVAAHRTQHLFIIDPEAPTRHALLTTFASPDCIVTAFPSAEDFLQGAHLERPACAIVSLQLPRMDGESLLRRLRERQCDMPLIITAAAAEVPTVVRLMRLGAHDLLLKPLDLDVVRQSVQAAWAQDETLAARHRAAESARHKIAALTPRERELFDFFAQGLSYKEIAQRLGISPRTVENHRAHLNIKLGHEHVTDFVRLSMQAHADEPAGMPALV